MYKYLILISLLLLYIFSFQSVKSESVNVMSEFSYDVERTNQFFPISALLIDDDTLISCSTDGIWAKSGNTQSWKIIIENISHDDIYDFMDDCREEKELWSLYSPTDIFKYQNSGEIIVFEGACNYLVEIKANEEGVYFAQKWQKSFNNINYHQICFQDDMFVGTRSYSDEKLLVYGNISQKGTFKRIFKYPPLLDRKLDSVTINRPYSYPAFNPADSTFWLAFWGYDYIYIINKKGVLLDSLAFSSPDYIAPQPPVSRLKSQAVHKDWLSKWTPVKVFKYVPPGYFILQFLKGRENIGVDTIPLHGTIMWTSDRKPVKLALDPHWQLAGVQPDGRVIFANYAIEDEQCKIELHVARIVP